MKLQNKKGFTLIELLVVITIIGILATWAVATYTSQIQKARDTTRINDIKALQSGIEQVYQDWSEYPKASTFSSQVTKYVEKLPKDPKHNQACNDWWIPANTPVCAYTYAAATDSNSISFWAYEVTTAFENRWNVDNKAAKDGWWTWVESARYEMWINIATNTAAAAASKTAITSAKNWACSWAWVKENTDTNIVYINWNPTTISNECD